jgi:hypothetical protein
MISHPAPSGNVTTGQPRSREAFGPGWPLRARVMHDLVMANMRSAGPRFGTDQLGAQLAGKSLNNRPPTPASSWAR